MADTRGKRKKRPQKVRQERRFEPVEGKLPIPAVVGLCLGGLGLGAGVCAQWIADPPRDFAGYLIVGSMAIVAMAFLLGRSGVPVRVGDAGVGLERGSEIVRLAWCDIERIRVEGKQLVLRGDSQTVRIPIAVHKPAIARILAEAVHRLPDIIAVPSSFMHELPKPQEAQGELLNIEELQVAGRTCAECHEVITMEREARLCAVCGQVYHAHHVPRTCQTCEAPVAGRALRPEG